MNRSMVHNISAYLKGAVAFLSTAVTAGGAGDATEIDGLTINRNSYGSLMLSAKLIVGVQATMASGETITIAANFQDSASGSSWSDYGDALAATTVVDAAGGAVTASPGVAELAVDLGAARQYIRAQVTPNMSRAGTDTAVVVGVVVLGGADVLPAA